MAIPRTCSHIKVNGVKCGSPALRHHTLCYFHYRWQKRVQRMARLGGPAGTNTGIELPLLENHESMLLAIMEIQAALLDGRIERKTASTLLYSLQVPLQSKLKFSGLCDTQSVLECPEFEYELDCDRVKGLRPAKEKCDACPTRDTCLSPKSCRKLPKSSRKPICHAEERSDEASLSTPRSFISSSDPAAPASSDPVAPASCRQSGGRPARPSTTTCHPETSPARECGVSIAKKLPIRAPATSKLETRNSKLINTLLPNTIQSIDLPPKSPQLAANKGARK